MSAENSVAEWTLKSARRGYLETETRESQRFDWDQRVEREAAQVQAGPLRAEPVYAEEPRITHWRWSGRAWLRLHEGVVKVMPRRVPRHRTRVLPRPSQAQEGVVYELHEQMPVEIWDPKLGLFRRLALAGGEITGQGSAERSGKGRASADQLAALVEHFK